MIYFRSWGMATNLEERFFGNTTITARYFIISQAIQDVEINTEGNIWN